MRGGFLGIGEINELTDHWCPGNIFEIGKKEAGSD
jgi:hypothetical protein